MHSNAAAAAASAAAAAVVSSSSTPALAPLQPPLTPLAQQQQRSFLSTPQGDSAASALWNSMLALSPGDAAAAPTAGGAGAAAPSGLHSSLLTPASSIVHPTKQNLFSLMHHSQQQLQQQREQQHHSAGAATASTPSLDSMLSSSALGLATPLHSSHQSSDGGMAMMQHGSNGVVGGGVAVDDPVHSLLALTPTLPNRSSAFRSAHAGSSSLVGGAAATSPLPQASAMMNAQLGSPLQLLPPSTSPTSSLLSSRSPLMRRDMHAPGLMSDSPAPVSGMPSTRHRGATAHLMARAHIPISPGMQLRGGGGGGVSNGASPSPHSQLSGHNPHLRTHELQQAQSAAFKHGAHSHAGAAKSSTIDTPGSTSSSTVSTRSTMRTVFQINGRSGATRSGTSAAAAAGTTVAASSASAHGSGGGGQHMTAPSSGAGATSISLGSAGSSNGKPQRSCNKKLGFDETAKPLSQQASPKTVLAQQRAAAAAAEATAAAESKMQESADPSASYGRTVPLSARNLATLHTRSLSSTGALLHSPATVASATPDLLSPPPIMLAGSSSFFAAPPLMHSSSSTSPPIPNYHAHHSHSHRHHHSASPASPFMPAASPSPTTLLHQHNQHHSVLHRAQHSSTPTNHLRQQHSPSSSGMVGGGGSSSAIGSPGGPGQLMMVGSNGSLFSPHFSPGGGAHSALGGMQHGASSSQSHRPSLSQHSSQSPSPAPSSSTRDHELPPSTPLASSAQVPQFTTSLALASDKKMATPMPLAATAAAAVAAAAVARKESRGSRTAAPRGEQSFESPKPERQSSRVALAVAAAQAAAVEAAAKNPGGAPDSGSSAPTLPRSYSAAQSTNGHSGGGGGGCRGCNCKKSKCLKLYCECFARQGYCNSDCKCHGCQNTPNHSSERERAITTTLQRDSKAFFRASGAMPGPDASGSGGALKGCHCKKSSCRKKYCECFQAGVECTSACKCIDCLNGACVGSHPRRGGDDDEPVAAKKKPKGSGGKAAAAAAAAALLAVEKKASNGGTKRGAAAAALSEEDEQAPQSKRGGSGSSGATGGGAKRRKKDHAPAAAAVAQDDAAADDGAEDPDRDASTLDDAAVSPATSNGASSSSLSSSSLPHSGGGGAAGGRPRARTALSLNVRAQAAHVTGAAHAGSSFSVAGVLGLSFHQQAAAHQKARSLAAPSLYHASNHDNSLASDDPDLTSCDNSLQEVMQHSGVVGDVTTPIKRAKNGLKRPAADLDTTGGDVGGLSALETLVEVASPSPRAPHKSHLHTHAMHPPSAASNAAAAQAAAVAAAANRLSLSRQGYPSLSSSAALSPLSSNVSTSSSTALTPDRDMHKRHRNLASYNGAGGGGAGGSGGGHGHGHGHSVGGHAAGGVHLSSLSGIAVSPFPQLLSPVRRNAPSPQMQIGGIGSPYAGSGLSSSPTHGFGMGVGSSSVSSGLLRAPHLFSAPSPLLFHHGASLAGSSLASHLTLTPHQRTLTPEGASAGSEDNAAKEQHMHEMAPVAVI